MPLYSEVSRVFPKPLTRNVASLCLLLPFTFSRHEPPLSPSSASFINGKKEFLDSLCYLVFVQRYEPNIFEHLSAHRPATLHREKTKTSSFRLYYHVTATRPNNADCNCGIHYCSKSRRNTLINPFFAIFSFLALTSLSCFEQTRRLDSEKTKWRNQLFLYKRVRRRGLWELSFFPWILFFSLAKLHSPADPLIVSPYKTGWFRFVAWSLYYVSLWPNWITIPCNCMLFVSLKVMQHMQN